MSVFSNCGVNKTNDISVVAESVINEGYNIESLEEGVFKYTASMIPVAMRETSMGTKYIVEYDMLKKLACCESYDAIDAFRAVCEENDIDSDDAYVLMNDPDTVVGEAYDAYNGTDDAEDSALYESVVVELNSDIKDFNEAGINMLKTDYFMEGEMAIPNIKIFFRSLGDQWRLTEKSLKRSIEKAISNCKTRADYLYTQRTIKMNRDNFDMFKEDKWYDEKIAECQKFLDANPAKTEEEKKAARAAKKAQK